MGDRDRDSPVEKDRSRERSRRDRTSRYSDASRDRSADRGGRGSKSSNSRVYVSNIPYEYRWQDMKDLFRSQVGDVQFVELFVDENDKSRGCGIVEFSDQHSVKKCLEVMQRYEVKTRKLIIKDDSGNVRDKHGNLANSKSNRGGDGGGGGRSREDRYDRYESQSRGDHHGGGGGGGSGSGENKWGNTYGLSPQFLDSLRIDTPLCNRIFVANLEYNVDKKKLKEVFRLAGRIVRVDLSSDKDGRSRGFAIVEYDHPVEAVQAISMFNNQTLNDRTMSVRLDRANEVFKLPDGLKGIGMGLGSNGEPLKDVARNLASIINSNQTPVAAAQAAVAQQNNGGAGLLGAVPNQQALQVAANALQGLNSVNLSSNLASMSSLLGNGLTDLSLMAANPLSAAQLTSLTQAAAAAAANNSAALAMGRGHGGGGDVGGGVPSHGFSYNTGGGVGGGSGGGGSSSNRSFSSFEAAKSVANNQGGGYPFGGGGGRDNNFASLTGNSPNLMRSSGGVGGGGVGGGQGALKDGYNSRKVLISNLPASASYKMLNEKFNEFGDVQHLEEKGAGSMLIVYSADWQAERAIKNLDRARIDGRTIEARFYY